MSNRSKPCDDDREYYIYHFKWNGLILQNMKENKKYCGKDCHFTRISFYRPQRSWGKAMFLQVCVILFTGGILDQVHPPGPGTPPGTRYTPQDQVHPQTRYNSPRTRYTPPGPGTSPGTRYTTRCRACWEIWSTRGQYVSYWNAILLSIFFLITGSTFSNAV